MNIPDLAIKALVSLYQEALPGSYIHDGQPIVDASRDSAGFYYQIAVGWTSDQDPVLSDYEHIGLARTLRATHDIRHSLNVQAGDTGIQACRDRATFYFNAMQSALAASHKSIGVSGIFDSMLISGDVAEAQNERGCSVTMQFSVRVRANG